MKGVVINNDRLSFFVMLIKTLKSKEITVNLTNNNDWRHHWCQKCKYILVSKNVRLVFVSNNGDIWTRWSLDHRWSSQAVTFTSLSLRSSTWKTSNSGHHVFGRPRWTCYNFCRRWQILLIFGDLFALRCYTVGAEFGYNPTLFVEVMKMFTLLYFFPGHTVDSVGLIQDSTVVSSLQKTPQVEKLL